MRCNSYTERVLVFFFWIYDGKIFDYKGYSFTSHYFNIITDGNSASGTASSSAGPSAAASEISVTSSANTPSPTSDQPPTNTHIGHTAAQPSSTATSGLSSTLKISIGVGVGVGIGCLLIGLVIGLLVRRRAQQSPKTVEPYYSPEAIETQLPGSIGTGKPALVNGRYAGELPGNANDWPNKYELATKTPELP